MILPRVSHVIKQRVLEKLEATPINVRIQFRDDVTKQLLLTVNKNDVNKFGIDNLSPEEIYELMQERGKKQGTKIIKMEFVMNPGISYSLNDALIIEKLKE